MKTDAVSPSYAEFKEQTSKGKEKRERGGDNKNKTLNSREHTVGYQRGGPGQGDGGDK